MVDDVNANKITQNLPNFSTSDFTKYFDVELQAGDILLVNSGAAGRKWTTLSANPLSAGTISRVTSKITTCFPARFFFEMSVSQRYRGDYGIVSLRNEPTSEYPIMVPQPKPISIASISQATTTLTIVLQSPFDGNIGDWVNIKNVPDNRLNYFELS